MLRVLGISPTRGEATPPSVLTGPLKDRHRTLSHRPTVKATDSGLEIRLDVVLSHPATAPDTTLTPARDRGLGLSPIVLGIAGMSHTVIEIVVDLGGHVLTHVPNQVLDLANPILGMLP